MAWIQRERRHMTVEEFRKFVADNVPEDPTVQTAISLRRLAPVEMSHEEIVDLALFVLEKTREK